MSASFGLYLGCTSACVAVCKDGRSQVIANYLGDRVTPSVVGYIGTDVLVGLDAKQNIHRYASNIVTGVKKIVGKTFTTDGEDLRKFISQSPVKVLNKNGQPVFQVTNNDKQAEIRPIKTAGLIFKNLMDTAKSFGCETKTYEAVVTVPVHFNEEQRSAIENAAKSVGFKVLRVINEVSAALLAYDIGQNDPDLSCKALVLRIGGQSLDIAVVSVTSGMYRVMAHRHDDSLGGRVVDDVLVDYLKEDFRRQSRFDCSKNERSLMKLRLAAESCKQTLRCSVDSLYEGIDFACNISRTRFDALCEPFVQSCLSSVTDLVSDLSGVRLEDISKVVLCGGVTKMPLLQQRLQDLLPTAEFFSSIPPDEVIATGAACEAAILSGKEDAELEPSLKSCTIPCLPQDVLIQSSENSNVVLFPRGTPVPFRKEVKLSTNHSQGGALLHLLSFQSDKEEPMSILKVVTPEPLEDGTVRVVFHFKRDGSLHVTCCDSAGGNVQSVTVGSSQSHNSPRKQARP